MRGRWTIGFSVLVGIGMGAGAGLTENQATGDRRRATGDAQRLEAPSGWRVTRGRVEAVEGGRARVLEPTVRAVVPGSDGEEASLRFRYLGPTEVTVPLGSGEVRRQVGLKLRAADGCNLVYVMWRIAPRPGLVVSLKRNPGARTHRACGTRGYRNLKPRLSAQPAPLAPGAAHTLHARLDGQLLRVEADGALAWEGDLGDEAASLRGPAGWRSDNARLELDLRTRPLASPTPEPPPAPDDGED